MSRTCPQCSQVNEDETAFCRGCGYRFQATEPEVNDATAIQPASLTNVSPDADPSATLMPENQPAQGGQPQPSPAMFSPQPAVAPAYPPPVTTPQPSGALAYPPPMATPNPAQPQGAYMPPAAQQGAYSMQQAYGQPPYGAPSMAQAPSTGTASLQRAFAGKGTPVHHRSWLLNGKGKQVQPVTLRNSLIDTMQKQGVLGVNITSEHLREQGIVLEERDYVRVQYGISSVFVYMAPMGQSLYVSRTSTVQQSYSRTRMVVLSSLFVLMLICLIFYIVINPDSFSATGGFGGGAKTFFGYAFDGLLFFFLFLLLRSFVFWLTDNDFLAFLRPNRLNDFTLDALSCIELTTDKALRETLEQAGLDAEAITHSAQSYAPQQALHQF